MGDTSAQERLNQDLGLGGRLSERSQSSILNHDGTCNVRFRKDGVLERYMSMPANFRAALVSRLKIMANMDISERRKPQDGHLQVTVDGDELHFRVSVLPTACGEKCVVRLLKKDNVVSSTAAGLSAPRGAPTRQV